MEATWLDFHRALVTVEKPGGCFSPRNEQQPRIADAQDWPEDKTQRDPCVLPGKAKGSRTRCPVPERCLGFPL